MYGVREAVGENLCLLRLLCLPRLPTQQKGVGVQSHDWVGRDDVYSTLMLRSI
jgi:hypothetical protein